MLKAKHLKFLRVENQPESLHCNHCNRTAKPGETSWRIADIPIHEGRDTASIVVCSKSCQRALVSHPRADEYVNDIARRCEQLPAPEASDQTRNQINDIVGAALRSLGLKIVS